MTLSLTGRILPASEKAMIRHGAPPDPQLRNEDDWAWPGHTLVAFDYLHANGDFLAAGHWHLQPPESSSVPPCALRSIWTFGTTSPVCLSTSQTDAWHTLGPETSYTGFTLDHV